MSFSTRTLLLAGGASVCLGAMLAGCGQRPELQVEVAAATAAPAAAPAAPAPSAPPLAPGAEMPAGHPPIDAAMPAGDAASSPAGALPAGHPSVPAGATMGGMVQPGGEGAQAISWSAPADWVSVPPANGMRRAQYRVPGSGGDGECAVFYFGPGQGGDPQSNAERWASQFTNPDGSPARDAMKTRAVSSGGMKVLFVETRGTYMEGSMTGGAVASRPDYALLGAIVEGPDANWFFKLTGPAATIAAQRQAFETMIGSMKRGAA